MQLTIRPQLRYGGCVSTQACERNTRSDRFDGYWLPGDSHDAWIAFMIELTENSISAPMFFKLPSRKDDPAVSAGLVAFTDIGTDVGRVSGAIGLRLIEDGATTHAPSCWVAWSDVIEPNLPSRFLLAALPSDREAEIVWLPNCGLVVLDHADQLAIADLLRPPILANFALPKSEVIEWYSPPEVPALPHRLAGLQWLETVTLDDLFGVGGMDGAGDDIGCDSEALCELADDDRKGTLAARTKNWLLNKLDQFADKRREQRDQASKSQSGNCSSGGRGPARNKRSGRANPISAAVYRRLSKSVQQERDRQLDRLLRMTKNDPDRALRYALPLASGFRGLAIPGAKLISRIPQFSLSGIGGGGPADSWDIDPYLRSRLNAAYMEMANREAAAGRYRRAAYIHANLIGDFGSAANSLEQGKFYREAAVVYRDKLKRPAAEARCLLAAGLYEQAAAVFAALKDHENEYEAWRRAGRNEEANASLERAANHLIAQGRMVDAAEFVRHRIGDRPRAIELLLQQWPAGHEVRRATAKAFEWIGQDGDPTRATKVMRSFVDNCIPRHRLALVELTHTISLHFPDRELQREAEDQCRVAISNLKMEQGDFDRGLNFLRSLDTSDPLLVVDVNRYRFKERTVIAKSKAATTRPKIAPYREPIQRLSSLRPPEDGYRAMKMIGRELFALRINDQLVELLRVARADDTSIETLETINRRHVLSGNQFEFAARPQVLNSDQDIYVRNLSDSYVRTMGRLPSEREPTYWSFHGGWPACLTHCDAGAMRPDGSFVSIETNAGEILLRQWSERHDCIRTRSLNHLLTQSDISLVPSEKFDSMFQLAIHLASPSHIDYMGESVVVVVGKTLIVSPEASDPLVESIGHSVNAMDLSPPHTRKRIAIAHEGGLSVYWPEIGQLRCQRVDTEIPFQHVQWMPGGRLFGVSERTLHRYHTDNQHVKSHDSIELRGKHPLALLRLSTSVVGVADESGLIERF